MPYLETTFWAKNVLRALYTMNYIFVIIAAMTLILRGANYSLSYAVTGIMVPTAIVAIAGVWSRKPHLELVSLCFIAGGVSAYAALGWIRMLNDLLDGNAEYGAWIIRSSVFSIALMMLLARLVLLTAAVQKNRQVRALKV